MKAREHDIHLERNGGSREKYRSREDVFFLSAESVAAAVVMISGASGVRKCGHRECRIERENALTDNIEGKSSNADNRVPSSSACPTLLVQQRCHFYFYSNTLPHSPA